MRPIDFWIHVVWTLQHRGGSLHTNKQTNKLEGRDRATGQSSDLTTFSRRLQALPIQDSTSWGNWEHGTAFSWVGETWCACLSDHRWGIWGLLVNLQFSAHTHWHSLAEKKEQNVKWSSVLLWLLMGKEGLAELSFFVGFSLVRGTARKENPPSRGTCTAQEFKLGRLTIPSISDHAVVILFLEQGDHYVIMGTRGCHEFN